MFIPFGAWTPDKPDLISGVSDAKNVIPIENGYIEFPSLSVYSGAIGGRCQGAFSAQDNAGNVRNYSGDSSALYAMTSATWSAISTSGGYSCASEDFWSFDQYGENVYAANIADPIQVTVMASASFSMLASAAPKARYVAVVRDFLVAAFTYDSTDGTQPQRVWWPAIGNPASWPTPGTDAAISVQSDNQILGGNAGWIQGIVGGEYGVIFQERGIQRMFYVGGDTFFQFDQVENARGTPAPRSIAPVGSYIFYLGQDGFYLFDGNASHPVGADKVDRYFWADIDKTYIRRISSAVDVENKLVIWAYPGQGSSGIPNKFLMYNWKTQQWSRAEVDVEYIYWSLGEGYTLDQLDNLFSSIDLVTPNLDSRVWTGGLLTFSAFNSDHKLCTVDGTALDASIETKEVQVFKDQKAQIQKLRPYVTGASASTVTTQIGYRDLITNNKTWGSSSLMNSIGETDHRNTSRYHTFRMNVSGGFEVAAGIELVEFAKAGSKR